MAETVTADAARKTKMFELRTKLEELDAEILTLADKEVLNADEEARFEDLVTERDTIMPEYKKLEDRAARADEIKKNTYREIHGTPEFKKPVEALYGRDATKLDWREARDGALRILEDRDSNFNLTSNQQDMLDREVRKAGKTDLARRIIVTENEPYRQAFLKLLREPDGAAYLTNEERDAMQAYYQYRAQSDTNNAGGYAIPVFIDPSVILTDQESANPFLQIARQVDVNTNAWKGVSAAGVSWSFDAEASEVSDDAITLAQPSVTVYQARGFIPYSIEVSEDWPGFASEMGRLLAIGYDELLIDKFTRGNGTTEPRGILTALQASSGPVQWQSSTTSGAFGQEDVYKVWADLAQKYRNRASWLMNVDIMNRIRQFGSSNVYHAYTIGLMQGAVENLFARPVYESPYMPVFSSTTGTSARLIVGDFSNYVIARRSGMTVELVPQLFSTGSGRPTGSRGWFAHARIGGNSVNDKAFWLQQNATGQ